MENIISGIKESNLKLTLAFGIGLHHAGLHERDRKTVEELFVNQKIQVMYSVRYYIRVDFIVTTKRHGAVFKKEVQTARGSRTLGYYLIEKLRFSL